MTQGNHAWWVRTRWGGNKKIDRKIGPTRSDKREAAKLAQQLNARLALGEFENPRETRRDLRCGPALWSWHRTYSMTMKPSYETLCAGHIRNHLEPFFGDKDLREISESDLLEFIRVKIEGGLRPGTIKNALAVLRRVYSLLVREGALERNPASRLGELMGRLARAGACVSE